VGTTLVKTSPYYSNWGIALRQDDSRSLRRETWLGHNRLGQILTDLRDDVFRESHTTATIIVTSKTIPAQVQEPEQVEKHTQEQEQEVITVQSDTFYTPPTKEQFTFFNGINSIYHQEYIAIFTVSGFLYNCVEQFRQHRKALLFDDDVRAAQILDTTEPNEQKRLGLKVKHFVAEEWRKMTNTQMHEAYFNKFTQNKNIEQELLSTTGTTIAQACPFRGDWCTGYYVTEPNCQNRRT